MANSIRRCHVTVFLCLAGSAPGTLAQATVPLSVEAALAQPTFQPYAPLALSPDGGWVAYTLQIPSRANRQAVDGSFMPTGVPSTAPGARVRITEVLTGRTLVVGEDSATSWAPSWSPDGRYLAFYSDVDGLTRLWVRETATGRTRRVSDAIVRAHRAMQYARWTPDSRRVVMPIIHYGSPLPEAPPTRARAIVDSTRRADSTTVRVLRADPAIPFGGQHKSGSRETDVHESLRADLALVEVGTGRVTTLATGYWPHEYGVAPNGRFVAFTSERSPVSRPLWTVPYDVMVVPIDQSKPGAPVVVAKGVAITNYSTGMYWSPTSATILYSANDTTGREQYFAADSSDWRPRQVGAVGAADIGADSSSRTRSIWWDDDGRAFYVVTARGIGVVSMPDGIVRSLTRMPGQYRPLTMLGPQRRETAVSEGGRGVLVTFRNDSTKRMGFARLDLRDRRWQILRDEDRFYGSRRLVPTDITADGRVIYNSEDAQHPTDIWLANADFSRTRQITHVAPQVEGITFGDTRLIDFPTPSGPRRGTLLLPAGYRPGARYPLVVYPYPSDPRSNYVNTFGIKGSGTENMQLLATRGFAVLAPDVAPFDNADQMREIPRIIMAGVDHVIAMGIADSTRLGAMGHSWGGYTMAALITQTTRFGAAVMRGGLTDETAAIGILQTTGWAYGIQVQELLLGVPLWERPEIYTKNSPIYHLDRVTTPLLIIHGEAETTVPVFLAYQTFAALQRLGKEVEFARYEHEDHAERLWTYANQRDYLSRMLGWFTSHIGPAHDAPTASVPGSR
jgi:dipeptidyl aminopeptidase/acylaminoacyl peptidase